MKARSQPFQSLMHFLLAACLLLLAAPVWAQDQAQEETEVESEQSDAFVAPVIVDGEMLFQLRGSSALPAPERAERVQDIIIEVAVSSEAEDVEITFETTELGTLILADGVQITLVTEADAELDQMDLAVLSVLHGDAIRDAIVSYRVNRTEQALVRPHVFFRRRVRE